jgi:UDP-N-acetylglucosamine 2-epimerase (non-hydrolysing)
MKLTIVAGARPNFIKIAPLIREIEHACSKGQEISYRLVHTGQHYNHALSEVFFKELNIPAPHINLDAGSGSQSLQAANIMMRFEEELIQNRPDCVIVVGDVNSTMACAVTTKKRNIKLAHIEAGIRSFDRTMPEEINRIITDAIADYFFTTTPLASENLLNSGIEASKIFFVGNIMIDSLVHNIDKAIMPSFFEAKGLLNNNYIVLTLHRPVNVDDPAVLEDILKTLVPVLGNNKLVFPVHPRTMKALQGLNLETSGIIFTEALSYLQFIYLLKHSRGVITDSGGIQEETTWLGIPCITIRNTTERPETVEQGTNILVGDDRIALREQLKKVVSGEAKKGAVPDKWDGHTAERIVKILADISFDD